jgi:hypothetical protein
MFPGKIATKKAARAIPTYAEYLGFQSTSIPTPNMISTTPESTTTKSGDRGTQVGTWAKNSVLSHVRCPIPAKDMQHPSRILRIFFVRDRPDLMSAIDEN